MQRRQFLKTALVSSLASSSAFQALALGKDNRYRKEIGIQLYTLRNQLKADLNGTLKIVAQAGYKQVEPFGFPNAKEMINISKDLGLAVNSSHFNWESVTEPEKKGVTPFVAILDQAKEAGLVIWLFLMSTVATAKHSMITNASQIIAIKLQLRPRTMASNWLTTITRLNFNH